MVWHDGFPPGHACREDIFKEIDILCGLNHENVVYLKEYFEEGNKVRQAARFLHTWGDAHLAWYHSPARCLHCSVTAPCLGLCYIMTAP